MERSGLILEGGGLRGIFTAGVLDYLLEQDIHFPYVIGVSMGACNGVSYVSRQHGRSLRIPLKYIGDPRYISVRNLFVHGSYFGMDFIFNEVPMIHDPFDFDTFEKSKQRFIAVAANCETGQAEYFEKEHWDRELMLKALSASSSLPFISKMVEINGNKYLDGGIADSIPIEKALADGITKPIVILTRPLGYRKKSSRSPMVSKVMYTKYPEVTKMMETRADHYNREMEMVEALEAQGKVFVIRPNEPIQMGRTEKNKEKLQKAYDYGYDTIKALDGKLLEWLNTPTEPITSIEPTTPIEAGDRIQKEKP